MCLLTTKKVVRRRKALPEAIIGSPRGHGPRLSEGLAEALLVGKDLDDDGAQVALLVDGREGREGRDECAGGALAAGIALAEELVLELGVSIE
jgi:hypothetical protein